MHYIFIDYENVQPKSINSLKGKPCKIFVFVGAAQSSLPFIFANALQKLGDNAVYVKVSETKPNALDFHIAFYIGELSAKDRSASYHIISKDKGFDPLVKHLNSRKIKTERVPSLQDISVFRVAAPTNFDEKIAAVIENLRGRGLSKPRKIETLTNTINSLFTQKLRQNEVTELINYLKTKGFIITDGQKVTYKLPKYVKAA